MANAVSSINTEALSGSADPAVPDIHGFGLTVQSAVGPKSLDGRGLQGRVLVAYSLAVDGSLQAVRITQSSGHHELDNQVLALVGRASFPTPPSNMTQSHRTFLSAFTFT